MPRQYDPNPPRPTKASRVRIWCPFVIGLLGGSLAFLFESQVGRFLGVYNPLMGYAAADIYTGAMIGFIAALASRTWAGLLALVLGLMTVAPTLTIPSIVTGGAGAGDVLFAAVYVALLFGLFGVPSYAVVTGVVYVIRWVRRAA